MTTQKNAFAAFSDSMADAAAKAGAATVLVNARRRMPASGVVFAADLVVTADHVIEREEEIGIRFGDGSEATAKVVGRDPASDLAVLRLSQPAPAVAEIASAEPRLGELVLALGRPGAEGIEASLGVISAFGGPARTRRGGLLERYIRTDTVPYPGFSGGPLVNASGQVVGINTSGLTPGAALTIPAALALHLAKALAEHGHIRRGYLGVRSQPVELPASAAALLGRAQRFGLLLVGVDGNTPAGQAGLMVGDILVGLGDAPVQDADELSGMLTGDAVGKPVNVQILRGGQPQTVAVLVGER